MRKWVILLAVLAVVGVTLTLAQEGDDSVDYEGKYPSPEFPTGVDWLNVPAPLTLADLRGKIVLLDFWTYGCINCIHMIPTLEQLEEKYGDALAVIGVHSAKFENEGQTENIRQIVQRYNLHHPVINDHDFQVWGTFGPYGVQAWPTFVIIDPRGNILAVQPGEVPFEAFDRVIGGMVEHFDG
ncbi:MAG: redoxin domain-containing protein, partial [Anaerolineae bacterium]|nr:redoxin domain-containing protein [Anaerolineae bacterium]